MSKKQKAISIISLMLIIFSISSCKSVFKNTNDEINIKEQEKREGSTENEFDAETKEDIETDEKLSNSDETLEENQTKDDKKEESKKEKEQTKEENSNNKSKPSSSSNSSSTNSSNSNNTSTKKPTSSSTTTTKPSTENNNKPSTNTSEENNDEVNTLRKQIENTYGITIKYGNEIGDYKPKMLKPTILDDKEKIKKELNLINNELKKYPNGFFREFNSNGMPLTIYLVSSVPGNAFSGNTDREFMNNIKITLTENYFFEYTFNHEIMHYIDAYLEIKMYPNNPYDEYMALNPVGFTYGQKNQTYNYGNNGVIKGAYFLNDYSQSGVREDRAEIFKNMITRFYKPAGMFDDDEVLNKKALVIDKQIRQYFKSANGTLYWDKIISK